MECLTEAAICSQLANRDLFGQWAQPSTQQTSASLLVHSRKNQTLAALLSDSNTTLGQAFKTKCLCPTVTIQWVPTAFLEAMSVYSQLNLGPKIISKGLEEKSNEGKKKISIENTRQGVTEWLYTISKNSSRKGMECMMYLKGYQSPQGGFGKTMFALKSGRTPSITFQRKSEERESKSNSKLPVECVQIWYSSPQGFKIICKLKTIFRKTVKLVRTSGSIQTFTKPSVMSLNSHTHTHKTENKCMACLAFSHCRHELAIRALVPTDPLTQLSHFS